MSYTFKKSTVESYKAREIGFGWADITIDARDESGRIQIASDFGDWQFYWTHCGKPFKEFLMGLDINYTASKFKANRHFDLEKNINAIRNELNEQLENGTISNVKHSIAIDELKEIQETCSENVHEFWNQISQTEHLYNEISGSDWETVNSIDPGFERFWNEIWLPFTKHLKEEILTPNN